MSLLDKFKKSRFAVQKEDQPTVTPYQQTVLQEYAVRFKSTLDSAQFDSYTKIEAKPAVGIPALVDYLVAQNDDLLMTENNNNLIV